MTSEAIAKKILQLHRAGEPLNISAVKRNHPELLAAAFAVRPFLGWKQAIELAGLRYQDLKVDLLPEVECLICGGRYGGLAMHLKMKHGTSAAEYRESFPEALIFSEQHLAEKQCIQNPASPHWEEILTREYILDRIWHWHLVEGSCNVHFVHYKDRSITQATQNRGWPWDDLIRALGLNPVTERKINPSPIRQSRAATLALLQQRRREGKSLSLSEIQAQDKTLASGLKKNFLLFNRALAQAGMPVKFQDRHEKALREYPSPAAVTSALLTRAEQGKTLKFRVITHDDYPLRYSIGWHFDTYRQCLKQAGLDQAKTRPSASSCLPPEKLIAALRRRHQKGESLLQDQVPNNLKYAAHRHFQTWSLTLAAAGLLEAARKQRRTGGQATALYKSADEVIEALKARHAASTQPLINSSLRNRIYRHFPSCQSALAAAGLAYHFPDPDSVIAYLREHHRAGEIMNTSRLTTIPTLHSRIHRYFGSLKAAHEAAGIRTEYLERIDRRPPGRFQTAAEVITALRQRAAEGSSLLGEAIVKDDYLLHRKLREFFGATRPAMIAAGLLEQYRQDNRFTPRYPDPEAVIATLHIYAAEGKLTSHRWFKETNPPFFKACRRFFGGFSNAVVAAGLIDECLRQNPRAHLKLYPEAASVLAELRKRATASFTPGSPVRERYFDNRLNLAAKRYFGGSIAALKAAGLLDQYRKETQASAVARSTRISPYPDPASTVAALRDRHHRGLPLGSGAISKDDWSLIFAVKRHFGSIAAALRAADLYQIYLQQPNPPRQRPTQRPSHRPASPSPPRLRGAYPTPASVLSALQQRLRDGKSLTQGSVSRENSPLKFAAYRHFGSWGVCVEAAGLTHELRREKEKTVRADTVYPSTPDILAALRTREQSGQGLSSHVIGLQDKPLHAAIYRHFDSWSLAIEAAGLAEAFVNQRKNRPGRGTYPSKEQVIAAFRDRFHSGKPISANTVATDDKRLHTAVYRLFGSWKSAVEAAGLYSEHLKTHPGAAGTCFPTRQSVINRIRKLHEDHLPLTGPQIKKIPHLRSSIYRLFTSLKDLMEAANLWEAYQKSNPGLFSPYPEPQNIIAALQERSTSGRSMNCRAVETENPPLYTAIRRLFGQFSSAMRAAGLDSHLKAARARSKNKSRKPRHSP